MEESMEPPAKKFKVEEKSEDHKSESSQEDARHDADFTEDIDTIGDKFTVTEDKYNDFVNPEELEKLREFQVLDEVRSNDEDSNDEESDSSDGKSDVPEEEIEKMLEEDLPEDFKGAPKPKEKPYITRQKVVLEEKGVNHFEVLPLDWMMVRHYSGMPVYMHRSTRVCTLSKPYFLGKGNTRRHDIPISAIPCLAYRRALEEEEKQKEIDNHIQEQIKNGTWSQNAEKNKNLQSSTVRDKLFMNNLVTNSSETNTGRCPFLHNKRIEEIPKIPENHDTLICQNINNKKEVTSNCRHNSIGESAENDESDSLSHKSNEDIKLIDKSEPNIDQKECINQNHESKDINVEDVANEEKSVSQEAIINNLNKLDGNMETNDNEDQVITTTSQVNTSQAESTTEIIESSQMNDSQDKLANESNKTNVNLDEPHIKCSQTIKNLNEPDVEGSQTNHNQDILSTKAIETNDDNDTTTEADKTNDSQDKTNENAESEGVTKEIPLNRQPVVLPGGIVMPPPRVETVSTSWKTQHLTHEQVNNYCKQLFRFKTVNIMHFKRWADRRKYTKARKTLQYPTLPEGTKLITIPAQPANGQDNGGGKANKRDWVMNMNGRSYLSVFHEYVRRALQKQPVYEFKQLENASTPYQATVYIGGMQYGVGHGSSKRSAKSAAARASIHILIPEMRAELDQDQPDNNNPNEPDFSFFDYVGIEDPRITEFCAATCEPSPHAILRTCLLRNFGAGDKHIHTEMKKLEYQKIELTMKVGKHTATVVCKNKKTAKQRASQAILQALHPHVRSWGSLLRLYGSRSVKSCKEKKLEEQQITLLQDAARHNEPNHAVLRKLRHEMSKLRQRDQAVVPIGTLLLPTHDLPTHSDSNLNNVDL